MYQRNSDTEVQEDLTITGAWTITYTLAWSSVSSNSKSSNTYHLGSFALANVSTHADLGVIISSNLSWKTHHGQILNKVYGSLGLHYYGILLELLCQYIAILNISKS